MNAKLRKTVLATLAGTCLSGGAPTLHAVDVPSSLAVSPPVTVAGAGLSGEYWQRPVASILTDGTVNRDSGIDRQIRGFGAPTGAFRATRLTYTGNDLTPVLNWLAGDAVSFVGTAGNLDDGAFRFSGYLNIQASGSLRLGTTSDDGSRIVIGGLDILNNDGSHGDQTVDVDVNFAAAGMYPIEMTYFNGDWTSDNSPDGDPAGVNHSGNPDPSVHGGASFHLRVAGATVTAAQMEMFHPAQSDVTQPGDPILIVNGVNDGDADSGPAPVNEGVEHAIDNLGQKYLNFLDLGSGLAVQPRHGLTIVRGLRLYTANDEEPRDPASYVLEGSHSGLTGPWTGLASGQLALPSGRNPGGAAPLGASSRILNFANATRYAAYRLTFPSLKNAAAANSMQISEIELLGKLALPVSSPDGAGNALRFDGVDDHLTAAPPAVPVGNSAYTIEAWIRPDSLHTGAIAAWGDYGADNQVNAFVITPAGLANYWWANDLVVSAPDLTGAWHHVAATFDGTTRRILLDGVVVDSDTPVGHGSTPNNFRVGLANVGQYFHGQMDEIRIWNVSRSDAQIQETMRRQLLGNEPGLVIYYRLDESEGLAAFSSTGDGDSTAALVNGLVWIPSSVWPVVRTLPAESIALDAAELTGEVDGRSITKAFEAFFQWGTDANLGNELRLGIIITPGAAPQTFSLPLGGLTLGATYYFRTAAAGGDWVSYGEIQAYQHQRPCPDLSGLPNVIQMTLEPGIHAIANCFSIGGNTLGEVLPGVPEGTRAYRFTPGAGWGISNYEFGGWSQPPLPLPPGTGLFLQIPHRHTVTFNGVLPASAGCPLSSRFPPGTYLVGAPLPRACTFEEFMGFSPELDDQVFLYAAPVNTTAWTRTPDPEKAQSVHTYGASGWDVEPVLPVGSAAWVRLNLGPQRLRLSIAKPNEASLTVQGPPGSCWLIESRPRLGVGPEWLPLTEFTLPAAGTLVIPSQSDGASRFYRGERVAYWNDFEGILGEEWNFSSSISATPVGDRKFLGEFANDIVTLDLKNLPPHTRLIVSFDLFILKSWDGNRTDVGPDRFQFAVRNGPILLDTTFSNYDPITQGYPGTLTDNFQAKTGAHESNTLGYTHPSLGFADAVYQMTFSFDHTDPQVILDFQGVNLQDIADESWGLDNVRVGTLREP
jgi:hypothetical protein